VRGPLRLTPVFLARPSTVRMLLLVTPPTTHLFLLWTPRSTVVVVVNQSLLRAHAYAHPRAPVPALALTRVNGCPVKRKYAGVAAWTSSMVGQQIVNMDTAEDVADYATELNGCLRSTAPGDDVDVCSGSTRLPRRFCMHFLFGSCSSLHANVNALLVRTSHNCCTSHCRITSSSSIHCSMFCPPRLPQA
jgi:hypothetical protein